MIIKSNIFKVTLFGSTFVLIRCPKKQLSDIVGSSGSGKTAHGAYIQQVGNYLLAVNENGEYIRAQRKLTLSDNINEISTVTVEYPFAGIYEEKL